MHPWLIIFRRQKCPSMFVLELLNTICLNIHTRPLLGKRTPKQKPFLFTEYGMSCGNSGLPPLDNMPGAGTNVEMSCTSTSFQYFECHFFLFTWSCLEVKSCWCIKRWLLHSEPMCSSFIDRAKKKLEQVLVAFGNIVVTNRLLWFVPAWRALNLSSPMPDAVPTPP